MPSKKYIASGNRFSSWTVLREADFHNGRSHVFYICICDCGKIREVGGSELRLGKTTKCQSCANSETSLRHGECKRNKWTPEYRGWVAMSDRCTGKNHRKNYRDRGISVCEEWKAPGGFKKFLAHIGRKPSPKHSLDRIDNDRGYEPGNVRWATSKEQNRNKRDNHLITIRGETKCIAEWAEESPIGQRGIYNRLRRGWDSEAAVFAPAKGRKMLTDDIPVPPPDSGRVIGG